MIHNKTLAEADYSQLGWYPDLFEEIRHSVGNATVNHQHRAWEYSIVLDALKANVDPIKTVLDVGSGGSLFAAMATRLGYEVTVIDPSPAVSQTHDPGVAEIQADFSTFEFNGLKFDAVVALSVLEHIEDDVAFLQKMAALATQMVCLTVDFSQDGGVYSRDHLRTYTPKSLLDLSKKLGKAWKLTDKPDWTGDNKPIFDKYNFASLVFYHV